MTQKEIQHLYWRAGFGIKPKQLVMLLGQDRFNVLDGLFKASNSISPLDIDLSFLKDITPASLKDNPSLVKTIREK